MSPRHTEEEAFGGTEVPRGRDAQEEIALMRRELQRHFESPPLRERIIEREPKGRSKDVILDGLIVAAICALVAAVWTLGQSVTRLDVNQAHDEKTLDDLVKKSQGVSRGAD